MSRKKNKKDILEGYSAVIKREKKKLERAAKIKNKHKVIIDSDSSSSDSESSLNQIEQRRCFKKAKKRADEKELDGITSRLKKLGKLHDASSSEES